MIRIVGVRFRSAGKVYYFDPKDLQLRAGDTVIAETSKGQDYGVISTCTKMVDEELVQQPLRAIVRKTTPEDEERIAELRSKEKEALKVCREKVREHELEMKMVNAEYSFDGTKVLFYFTADGRVDFRSLVKDLAGIFHVRIELRQIGVRDETRMLGGIGICGRELCCATFLSEFQPVSIKMAKEQNLSLNPTKISGTCGRLMCCLKNEEATYEFLNARMPKMGEEAITADGQVGKVIELDVLRQRVRVLFEEGDSKEVEAFPVDQLTFRPKKKKDPSQQGKKVKGEKAVKGEKPERTGKGEESEKAGKGDRTEKGEKTERAGKGEKPGKGERGEKSGRNDKPGQGERAGKGERGEKTGQGEKPERAGKGVRAGKGEKPERALKGEKAERTERTGKGEKPGKGERGEKSGRNEKPGQGERAGKGERGEKPGQGEKPERALKGEKAERTGQGEKSERAGKGVRTGKPDREDRNNGSEQGEYAERKRPRRKKSNRPQEDGGRPQESGAPIDRNTNQSGFKETDVELRGSDGTD